MSELLTLIMILILAIPIVIYLSVKLATWAYLLAKFRFNEQYNNHEKEIEDDDPS